MNPNHQDPTRPPEHESPVQPVEHESPPRPTEHGPSARPAEYESAEHESAARPAEHQSAEHESAARPAEYELYVDPACPWSWLAVRWLAGVAGERELPLRFRSFSLWLRDGDQQVPGMPPMFRDLAVATSKQSLRLLRVFEALRAQGRASAIEPLYLAWGERVFQPGPPVAPAPTVVDELIAAAGLEQFQAAADDSHWDEAIEASMAELIALAGPKPLVPTLVGGSARHVLFTGAIVSAPLSSAAGLKLWDAVSTTANEPAFVSITTDKHPMPAFT